MQLQKMQYFESVSESAISKFLSDCRAEKPDAGVLALLPENEKGSVAILQAIANKLTMPIAGTIFPALVKDDTFVSEGVWLLCFEEMPKTWLYADIPADVAENAKFVDDIANEFNGYLDSIEEEENITLLMFFDALIPNIGTILDGLYAKMADRVNYLGSNPGSETFQPMACLFDNNKAVNNGLLALILLKHRGGILEHGYGVPEKVVHATSAEGNCISNIDWKPAYDIYKDFVRDQYSVEITRENFYTNAVHFPFGILRANNSVLVRIPVGLSDDGSLFCIGEVPANSVLTLLRASETNSSNTVEAIYKSLSAINHGVEGVNMLLFFCAGRHMHLGNNAAIKELHYFKEFTKASQVAGARSLGEIGPSTLEGGYPLFHNATLVATCL
ncbi:MAG: FIST C-terminal domain-containing protein [Holophagaceae bacterium]|nr:FIST C-terminal domain-containing protein [Holophagaceae bacterium]